MPDRHRSRTTPSRKQQHVDLVLRRDVAFQGKTTGLERVAFVHNALPEIDLSDIDTRVSFLGRSLAVPLIISCMTGGYRGALHINRSLAEVCESRTIALGVGSQRQALEDSRYHKTFSIVRTVAPTVPVIGNIGAAEIARMSDTDGVRRLVDLIRADAFAVHLNPLQELLQPEGTPMFRGVLAGIAMLVRHLSIPVIVKEIGAGISAAVARRLLDAGVRIIDVAGAGGTSWAGVELLRTRNQKSVHELWDWGIPTAHAVRSVAALKPERDPFTLIASGGISSGFDVAKCIALGADLVASARPIITTLDATGQRGLHRLLDRWTMELRSVMFLTGSRTIVDLQQAPLETAAVQ